MENIRKVVYGTREYIWGKKDNGCIVVAYDDETNDFVIEKKYGRDPYFSEVLWTILADRKLRAKLTAMPSYDTYVDIRQGMSGCITLTYKSGNFNCPLTYGRASYMPVNDRVNISSEGKVSQQRINAWTLATILIGLLKAKKEIQMQADVKNGDESSYASTVQLKSKRLERLFKIAASRILNDINPFVVDEEFPVIKNIKEIRKLRLCHFRYNLDVEENKHISFPPEWDPFGNYKQLRPRRQRAVKKETSFSRNVKETTEEIIPEETAE